MNILLTGATGYIGRRLLKKLLTDESVRLRLFVRNSRKVQAGPGLSRGRRDPNRLRIGDGLDFWKVVDLKPNKRLLLVNQMKVPGKAWLEISIEGSRLVVTAHYYLKGLWGRKTKRRGSAVELQAGDGDIRLKFFPDSHYGDPLEVPGVQFGL